MPEREACEVAIIGAGPAGLGAAYELHRRGQDNVVILEASSVTGGLSRTIACGDCWFIVSITGTVPPR